VTLGQDDKKIQVYNILSGELTLTIDTPSTGVYGIRCFPDLPLAMVIGALGPRCYDLTDATVFAAFSVEDGLQILYEEPSIHIGAEALTLLASRPPPPPPEAAEEGEDPAAAAAEDPEAASPPDIIVPLSIELARVSNAYFGKTNGGLSPEYGGLTGGLTSGDLAGTQNLNSGMMTQVIDKGSDYGGTQLTGQGGSEQGGNGMTQTMRTKGGSTMGGSNYGGGGQNTYGGTFGGGTLHNLGPTPSAFDGFPTENTDMVGKVMGYLRQRHGERRLRDIRTKKRRVP